MTLKQRIQKELTGIEKDLANPKISLEHDRLRAQKRVLEYVLKPDGK